MPVSVISAKSFPVKGIMEKNILVRNSAALCLPIRDDSELKKKNLC